MSDLDATVDLEIRAGSGRYEADDDRWHGEVADLLDALDDETGGLRRTTTAQPGSKGAVEAVILALGSAGAFRAAVQCWRAWLDRDRTRRLEITWTAGGDEHRVVVDSTGLDREEFQQLTRFVQKELNGAE